LDFELDFEAGLIDDMIGTKELNEVGEGLLVCFANLHRYFGWTSFRDVTIT